MAIRCASPAHWALFLGVNYYLWQSMGRIEGENAIRRTFNISLCADWLFIHLADSAYRIMSASEVQAMGGAQHPVMGNYGVMSSKNGAVNVMICITALSIIMYRRANRTMTISWFETGNILIGVVFGRV